MLKTPNDQLLPDSEVKAQFQRAAERLINYYSHQKIAPGEESWKQGSFYHQIMWLMEEPLLTLCLCIPEHDYHVSRG